MNIFITGISGWVGRSLTKSLVESGHKVSGCGFWRNQDELCDFWGECADEIDYSECDICDQQAIQNLLKSVKPDFVFHLAAIANISTCRLNPSSADQVNCVGSWQVINAAMQARVSSIHLASSSDVYGFVPEKCQPITEEQPLNGNNPYARSKIGMEDVGLSYNNEINVIITRLFTTTGVGQYRDAAISYFCWQAARAALGLQEPIIKCGNIDNYRSFLDLRDVISAYEDLLYLDPGENVFNISGAEEICLRDVIVKYLSELTGYDLKPVEDNKRVSDITHQVGDSNKFFDKTGWVPRYTFQETVQDVFNYWYFKLQQASVH